MRPINITSATAVSAIGRGLSPTLDALRDSASGLRPCDFEEIELDTFIGRIEELEQYEIADRLEEFDCRNNRLAQLALQTDSFEADAKTIIERYGPSRVAVVLGTSSSGVLEAEHAIVRMSENGHSKIDSFDFGRTQAHFSVTDFVQRYLKLEGPAYTISTACSSSAKVFGDAQQLIAADLCDAAIVGGVDSLCGLSIYGFNSLQLLSRQPCRPNDLNRDGISIGEAAGFAILERESEGEPIAKLVGFGESSDAHHVSAPHPEGLGAIISMEKALKEADLQSGDIDYINLHGTGSAANDLVEAIAIKEVFGRGGRCSSTKGWTGHTLGAAGILESVISMLSLRNEFLPQNLNLEILDPEIELDVIQSPSKFKSNYVATNSFGFGGSNCTLILAHC